MPKLIGSAHQSIIGELPVVDLSSASSCTMMAYQETPS